MTDNWPEDFAPRPILPLCLCFFQRTVVVAMVAVGVGADSRHFYLVVLNPILTDMVHVIVG